MTEDRTGIAAGSEAGAAEQSETIRSGTESAAQKRPKTKPAVRDSLRRSGRSGGIAPPSFAPERDGKRPRRLTHRIGAEFRPEHIFTINPFLRGENLAQLPVDLSLAAHLKYSFRFRPGSPADRTYGGVYQGFGIAYYDFAGVRRSWAIPSRPTCSRERASPACRAACLSTTNGISAFRSDGNPMTGTTTASTP